MSGIEKMQNNMKTCLNCGEFFLYDKRKSNRKFCDENCRMEFYGIQAKKDIVTIRNCKFCEKSFECSASTPNKLFCSQECLKSFYKNKHKEPQKDIYEEKRNCSFCGSEFLWSSRKSNQIYCSVKCRDEATKLNLKRYKKEKQQEKRICSLCGSEFLWSSSKPNQIYCSAGCRDAATKLKIKNYNKKNDDEQLRSQVYLKVLNIISKMDQSKGASCNDIYIDYRVVGDITEKTREEVLKRDHYECQICKRKDSLHLHHLIKRKYGGNHKAENLITLCASCHRHIETGDIEHATKTCLKNAKRYYGYKDESKSIDIYELTSKLTFLFNKLKESSVGDDSEIMVCLDETLELIDVE